MTHEQRKAVERLTQHVEARTARYGTKRDDAFTSVTFADLRTLLALVREPVASVEGTVRCSALSRSDNWIESERRYVQITLPPEYVGQRVRIDVHAVDAGEEK